MTFYVTGFDYDRPRMQDPYFVSKTQVRQRRYDSDTETYSTTQGNAFTIERLMPVPYILTLNLDMWTSNTNQKFQLIEQIVTLFNPSLEIQSTDSYLDWTSLSVVELDRTTWSSRSIPVGTEDPIDIFTMSFKLPIWISSPAKVKKLGVVEKIIASVYDSDSDAFDAIQNEDLLLGTRQLITPYGYQVLLLNGRLQLLKESAVVNPQNTSVVSPPNPPSNLLWPSILGLYGTFRPGISQIRLSVQWDDDNVIVGTAVVDPTDARFLLYTPDSSTLPQNTLAPVNAVIDPLRSGPGQGLAPAQLGQRYLLLDGIGNYDNPDPAAAWGNVAANANDIIEYNGVAWQVSFDSENSTTTQYVTNINTEVQYRWIDNQWVKSYDGVYPGGEWNIVL
jgi:hypothetical protein